MISVPHVLIPILVSAVLFGVMLRPYQKVGDYDFGAVFRLLWLVPIAFVWVVYFGVLLAIKSWWQ